MNLDNPSAQAVEIAEGELAAICQAVGAPQITDSQQLHGRPLDVTVTQRKSDNGKVWNDCRGFGAVQPQVCATTTATYAPQQHVGQPQPQPMPPRQDPPPPPFPADGTDGPFAGDVGDTDDNPF